MKILTGKRIVQMEWIIWKLYKCEVNAQHLMRGPRSLQVRDFIW